MKLFGTLAPPPRRRDRSEARGSNWPSDIPGGGFGMAETNRLFADWNGLTTSLDAQLVNSLVTMRQRSRHFAINEDYARAYLIAARNNIIGPAGVNFQADAMNPARPLTVDGTTEWEEQPDTQANDAIEAAYREFSKATYTDAQGRVRPAFCGNGRVGRTGFAHLGITTAERDGEFLFRHLRGAKNPWGYAVEPINADYLDETKNRNLEDGGSIRLGVQRDAMGEVTHYWLRKSIAGDNYWPGRSDPFASEPVPASDITHFFYPEDFEQSRGIPAIHAGAQRLKMLAGYEEAALEASRAAACKHEYFKRINDPNAPTPEYQPDAYGTDGIPLSDVEPGTREELPPGFDVVSIDPMFPHTEHGGFMHTTLGGVASGLGISHMTLTGNLNNANYSSMRAGLLPERDQWMCKQDHWIGCVELIIFLNWLRMALLKGAITLPNGAALPAARWQKFARCRFQGRRWPWVDPLKDQEANALALKQRTTTRTAIVAQGGGDRDEVWRQLQREKADAARRGLTLPEDVEAAAEMAGAKAALQAKKKPEGEEEPANEEE